MITAAIVLLDSTANLVAAASILVMLLLTLGIVLVVGWCVLTLVLVVVKGGVK